MSKAVSKSGKLCDNTWYDTMFLKLRCTRYAETLEEPLTFSSDTIAQCPNGCLGMGLEMTRYILWSLVSVMSISGGLEDEWMATGRF